MKSVRSFYFYDYFDEILLKTFVICIINKLVNYAGIILIISLSKFES